MQRTKVRVRHSRGLHARPASDFIRLMRKFRSEITIRKESLLVNGKSILGILMLAAALDTQLEIQASGDDEDAAIQAVESFFNACDSPSSAPSSEISQNE